MARQELIDYIKSGIEKGYTTASLKAILIGHGWNAGEVDEAISIAEGNQQMPEETMASQLPVWETKQEKPILLKIIYVLGFILCLLGILAGFMFLFPSSFNYLFNIFPNLINYVSVPLPAEGIFNLTNISYVFAIIVGIVGFFGFILLVKMEKAGMFLVIIAGLANIINSFISFDISKMLNIIAWALILTYIILKRDLFK